jgi:hypothetical protein
MNKQTCEILPKTDSDWIYLFYCKCRKSDGNPIIIKSDGNEYYADKVKFKNIGDMELEFNNSPKKIAQRGATTVLNFKKEQYNLRCIKTNSVYEIKGRFVKNFVVKK